MGYSWNTCTTMWRLTGYLHNLCSHIFHASWVHSFSSPIWQIADLPLLSNFSIMLRNTHADISPRRNFLWHQKFVCYSGILLVLVVQLHWKRFILQHWRCVTGTHLMLAQRNAFPLCLASPIPGVEKNHSVILWKSTHQLLLQYHLSMTFCTKTFLYINAKPIICSPCFQFSIHLERFNSLLSPLILTTLCFSSNTVQVCSVSEWAVNWNEGVATSLFQ